MDTSGGGKAIPVLLGHRRRARPQQRRRRHAVPAQHRPRRARNDPELLRQIAAHTAARDARHRHRLDLRADRGGAARRPLGPHLRGLFGGSRPWSRATPRPMVEGLQGKVGAPDFLERPRGCLGQALPRRRRHHRRQGPGRHPGQRGRAARRARRRLHRRDERRRADGDGLVLQLERRRRCTATRAC